MNDQILKQALNTASQQGVSVAMLQAQVTAQILGPVLAVEYSHAIRTFMEKKETFPDQEVSKEEQFPINIGQAINVASAAADGVLKSRGLMR